MNSASTTTDNDLKKDFQQLQIDASLANSTDLTAASSFATPVSSRTQNDWEKFYNAVDKSPPKAIREMEFPIAVEIADRLLRTSDIEGFANKTFEDLDKDQQAMMMLMVTKKMHQCVCQDNPERCAKALVGALKPETNEYKAMMSFVRKGGDRGCRSNNTLVKRFMKHCDTAMKEDGMTIFDVKKGPKKRMKPFLFLQRDHSYICAFNACSVLLYYQSYDVADESSIKANLSRYIRDEIDGLMIANLTLTTQKGAYLDDVLTGLMKSFGTTKAKEVQPIDMEKDDEDYNYNILHKCLQNGRPIALSMENFPTLSDFDMKHFSGKLSNHYRDSERPGPEDRTYHAVVCIGIKPRKGRRPPMLLIQDSCEQRPAFSIGLDLLMDMDIEETFYALPKDWKLNPDHRYKVTKESQVCFSGSPMAVDKNNKAYIIPKEPEPRRDMSRYLHRVDLRDVDGIVAYGGL